MMTKDEALKLALDAFGEIAWSNETQWQRDRAKEAIIAIKEALAQPERDYERGFVDGMQKQMQSSVDKAVNRMAQPEQEPAALVEKFALLLWDYQELERAFEKATGGKWIRKSNTPQPEPVIDKTAAVRIATALGWEPKRTWVGLTEEEIDQITEQLDETTIGWSTHEFAQAIEAKLKEKNNG